MRNDDAICSGCPSFSGRTEGIHAVGLERAVGYRPARRTPEAEIRLGSAADAERATVRGDVVEAVAQHFQQPDPLRVILPAAQARRIRQRTPHVSWRPCGASTCRARLGTRESVPEHRACPRSVCPRSRPSSQSLTPTGYCVKQVGSGWGRQAAVSRPRSPRAPPLPARCGN